MRCIAAAGTAAILLAGCGFGSNSEFKLSNASVQPNYVCPSTTADSKYDVRASINTHNGTSGTVLIKSVSVVMTVAAIHGGWLQPVGYRYDAGSVSFTPDRVGAGSNATLGVTIPSACRSKATGTLSYADYSVALTVVTSSGTFTVNSGNRHRIIA
jgi:hypothetical protein